MNIEKKLNSLKEYVKSKALNEADEIIKTAEIQVKEVEKEYKEKAEETYSKIIEEAKKKVSTTERREMAQSRAKASKMFLDAKNEILKSSLEELKDRIYALSTDKRYEELLEKLTLEAIKELGKKEVIVSVRNEDDAKMKSIIKKLEKDLKAKITLSTEHVKIMGGVIVTIIDNHVMVENTLENKFEEVKESFISLLFSRLNVDG